MLVKMVYTVGLVIFALKIFSVVFALGVLKRENNIRELFLTRLKLHR